MKKDTPIPKRLRAARVEIGLSQKHSGMAAGFDQFCASARMNQYETGKHEPDYNTLEALAKVFNVPVSYFYERDDKLAEIILNYGKLNFKQKMRLLKLSKEINTSSSEDSE